jgi:hypothetical protein
MEIPKLPTEGNKALTRVKKTTKVTAKTRKIVVLPELQTYVIQPNRVTFTIFDGFTLTQLKAFSAIMLNLQEAVKLDMNNGDFKQLNLFNQFEQTIKFDLSLKDITKDPRAYTPIKEAISQISEINVKIPLKDDKGKGYHISTSLITALIPDEADYKSVISIKIERTIAEYLIQIPKGKKGAEQYTRYMLEVALSANSSYTIRIYQLISSWKSKGGFRMSYKEFRHLLAIKPDAYSKYSDFKKKVLLPAQADLFEKADCWFNCDVDGFKSMERNSEGQKELYLNFKIITPEFKETMLKQRTSIVNLLNLHFAFKDDDLKKLAYILDNENISSDVIIMKILKISERIEESYKSAKPVKDKKAYALQSLLSNDWLK